MDGYYNDKLYASQLKKVYESAPPRIKQYLQAEIDYVRKKLEPQYKILDLGCGYGRIFPHLYENSALLIGIDTSFSSLLLGKQDLGKITNGFFACMDASELGFKDCCFDLVVCIQNGISAFKVDPKALIKESIRVTKEDGKALFSTYSTKFWKTRLQWFELQAQLGLIGKIDYEKTGDGDIVCHDGFRATTTSPEQFLSFIEGILVRVEITEVDESSLFFEIWKL